MLRCVCVTQELVLQETAKIQREVVGRVEGQSASAGIVYKVDSTSQPAASCDPRTGVGHPWAELHVCSLHV